MGNKEHVPNLEVHRNASLEGLIIRCIWVPFKINGTTNAGAFLPSSDTTTVGHNFLQPEMLYRGHDCLGS